MMPMMLAQEASIIDIIGVPFLLPKPSGAVLVFEAVLAGAPHEACVQNGACNGAHDALTEGGLEHSKTLPVLGFPSRKRAFLGGSRAALPEAACRRPPTNPSCKSRQNFTVMPTIGRNRGRNGTHTEPPTDSEL